MHLSIVVNYNLYGAQRMIGGHSPLFCLMDAKFLTFISNAAFKKCCIKKCLFGSLVAWKKTVKIHGF